MSQFQFLSFSKITRLKWKIDWTEWTVKGIVDNMTALCRLWFIHNFPPASQQRKSSSGRIRQRGWSPAYLQKPCCERGSWRAGSQWLRCGASGLARATLLPVRRTSRRRTPDTPFFSGLSRPNGPSGTPKFNIVPWLIFCLCLFSLALFVPHCCFSCSLF